MLNTELLLFVIVSSMLIVLVTVVIIILLAIYYRYKVLNRRRRHEEREEGMRQVEETEAVEETDHHEASALRGEAPPDYREAVVSREYKNINVESLNQFNTVATDVEGTVETETRQPPPY